MPETPNGGRFDEAEFLRRTFDRSIGEMERSREYFEKLLRHATWYITTVTAIGFGFIAFLGFRSYSDVESRMNAELSRVATDIKDQGKKTIQQTDTEIRENAKQVFETENIKAYVLEVAKNKTQQSLTGEIGRAVDKQVAQQITQQQPEIRKTVVTETKKAVDGLSPLISSNVSAEVTKQSSEALKPLRQDVDSYRDFLRVSTLSIEARNGNGIAYDQLETLGMISTNPDIREICVSTVNEIFVEMNTGLYTSRSFTDPKTDTQLKAALNDPNPLVRWAAIDGIAAKRMKDEVPELMRIMNQDNSLWVRKAAYQALQTLTGEKMEKFDKQGWNAWWVAHKQTWPPKQ